MAPTRREFLLAAGSLVLLVACGGDDDATTSTPDTTAPGSAGGTDTGLPDGFGVVQRFPNSPLFTPGETRLPVSVLDDTQTIQASGPATIPGQIFTEDGTMVTDFVALRRQEGMSPAYWEVRVQLDQPGTYVLRLEGDDGFGASFQVVTPDQVASPTIGSTMPGFDTPTVDDHRGVEPYCSLTPDPCPLHEVTLTEALASGKPVVYIVGTPAHCQTGTCAPGLEFLVAEHERLGDQVVMVHADVYADDKATTIAPAVTALKIDYEPVMYFMDATGTIVDRLDAVWDSSELRERLDALLSA